MKNSRTKYHIGCSGFYSTNWRSSLYPADSQNKDFLKLYSHAFDIVEINTTFYRKPTVKTLQKWVDETPDAFKFFIKIPKTISHQKPFENKKEDIEAFCHDIQSYLGEKLAGFLFQFPPSFHHTPQNMKWLTDNLTDGHLTVIEFRHRSWWNGAIFKIFKDKNWIFSGTSFPGNLPEDAIITNPNVGYYRLHGKPKLYKSAYSEEYLKDLADKMKETGKEFYILFNNTWGTAAVENSLYLKKILKSMKKLVVLSGAGVSAESGIRTFRDSNGLWENHRVEDVASPEGFARDPKLVLDFYNARRKQLKEVEPNAAHKLLAELEDFFDVHIITQNVDDLHERGGSTKIIHLHGELKKVRSVNHDNEIMDWENDLHLGDLHTDGSQLRPHIVWFGEMVPEMDRAIAIASEADLFLVIGTSMQVYPAASVVRYVPSHCEVFVIDPNLENPNSLTRNENYFKTSATEGMKKLNQILIEKYK